MTEDEAQALAAAAARVQELILKAAAAALDCMQAELNVNMLTQLDGTLADSQAATSPGRCAFDINWELNEPQFLPF